MTEKYEVVRIRRADGSIVRKAFRFEDGRVFVPGCRIEEGDEIAVDGEQIAVTGVEPAEFTSEESEPSAPLSYMVGKYDEGCLVTFETGDE